MVNMVLGVCQGAGRGKYGGGLRGRVLGVVSVVVGGPSGCWAR